MSSRFFQTSSIILVAFNTFNVFFYRSSHSYRYPTGKFYSLIFIIAIFLTFQTECNAISYKDFLPYARTKNRRIVKKMFVDFQVMSLPWEENKDVIRQQLTQLTNTSDLGKILATAAGMDQLSVCVDQLVRLVLVI